METLSRYLDLLATWNARVNLTALRNPGERVARLVGEVLPVAPLPEAGARLIDVGSGNGSPGLVLALLRPDLRVTLLEPRTRRWAFLREAARLVVRTDVEILRARHDGYPGPAAPMVTVRGLALPPAALAPLVEPGGRLVAFGGRTRASPAGFQEVAEGSPGRFRVFRRSPDGGSVSRET